MNWIKNNPQFIVIIILVLTMIFQHLFLSNSYKKEYERLLKEQEKKYEQQIDELHSSNDSILALNDRIKDRINQINKDITKKEAELIKLKKQNAKNTAKLNAMSDTELSSTFTELFN
jgi:septal ring factor EnvC (AmiA/AmiB activator)